MNAQLILTGDLSEITQALSSLNGQNVQVSTSVGMLPSVPNDVPVPAEKPVKAKASKPAPAAVEPEPEPVSAASTDFEEEETEEAPAEKITLVFLKEQLKSITGDVKKKAAVKEVMSAKFGADGLSKLDPADYDKFYNRIKNLL